MKQTVFQLQKKTIQFFYEVDKYWNDHKNDLKDTTIKKIKPLYKGFSGRILSPIREAFLYRHIDNLFAYKLFKFVISEHEFLEKVLYADGFFKSYYNTMCAYYFKRLKKEDMISIHESYKDQDFPLLDDTYMRCQK